MQQPPPSFSADNENAPTTAQPAVNAEESWKKANSARKASSVGPLVGDSSGEGETNEPVSHHHKSWFKRLSRSDKSGEKKEKEKKKKKSISDSGPYIFAFDPKSGKEVLQKNPHWPNEDSWKREKESEGQWAFGSMMGQQGVDFGGTVG